MAIHCFNATSDENMYSSPIPLIGLYTAAATSVCFLFMICDLLNGLHCRKPWIPCRFFSLNSLTLTLLAIATKLPVDLTSSMPSAQDQLSKLTGTVLICISMSFFSSSLLTQSDSECFSNIISLSIFVVTVIVNVCIQIFTGVIFSFLVEHVIIMSCMLLLLGVLWSFFKLNHPLDISSYSNTDDQLKKSDPLNSESKNMVHRLKLFYVSHYKNKAEMELDDNIVWIGMGMLSTLCTLVLSQAAFRSLVLKEVEFQCGISAYKWSMWTVVSTQIFTVLIGSIACVLRWWFGFKTFVEIEFSDVYFFPSSWVSSSLIKLRSLAFFKISKMNLMLILQTIAVNGLWILHILVMALFLLAFLLSLVLMVCLMAISKVCFCKQINNRIVRMDVQEWIKRNGEKEIKRLMEKHENYSPTHLIQLLSQTTQSEESTTNTMPSSHENKFSCLLLVIIARVAIVTLPDTLISSLVQSLDEAFEIICFIDENVNAKDSDCKRRCATAKELWMNRDNACHWFQTRFIKPTVEKCYSRSFKKSMDGGSRSQLQLDIHCALRIIKELKVTAGETWCFIDKYLNPSDVIDIFYEFIIGQEPQRTYRTINELYVHMEHIFVDILHFFLPQLPIAIFKYALEGPIIERKERAGFVLKFLCKLEPLEHKIHWSFPDGTGITSFITADPAIDTQRIEPVEQNVDVTHTMIEDCEIPELV